MTRKIGAARRGGAGFLLVGWALVFGGACPSAGAEPRSTDIAAAWRSLTKADLAAADELIRDNHPGAAPELRDTAFQARLTQGLALAQARAERVRDYGGYAATMAGFAGAFGDDHIAFRPSLAFTKARWAGYTLRKQGEDYVVAEADPAEKAGVTPGDHLVSCDGVAAGEMAERRLAGFRGDWSSGARRYMVAPFALFDTFNPFAPPPATCVFDHLGRPLPVTLNWRDIATSDLNAKARAAAPLGKAGMGVRTFGGGYWISLQAMDQSAAAVLREAQAARAEIQAAPLVVVDVRGNTGGSSFWGDQLAGVIWGDAARAQVARALAHPGGCSGSAWRATPDNLKTLQYYQAHPERFGPSAAWAKDEREVAEAMAHHQAFSRDISACTDTTPAVLVANSPASTRQTPQVVILTDPSCFSSCLLMLTEFRALGARQAGQGASAWSHYIENREAILPSGLGAFTTLQAVSLDAPAKVGPFTPDLPYTGDISDTRAIETWLSLAARPIG